MKNQTNSKPRNRKPVNNKPRKTFLKVKFATNVDFVDELLDIIGTIPFKKISIPIHCSRFDMEDGDRNKYITIGYIKNFDAETREFTLVVFDSHAERVKKLINTYGEDSYVTAIHGEHDGNVTTITKLVLEFDYSVSEEVEDEEADDAEEVEE